jgi:hypothetical protein
MNAFNLHFMLQVCGSYFPCLNLCDLQHQLHHQSLFSRQVSLLQENLTLFYLHGRFHKVAQVTHQGQLGPLGGARTLY